MTKNKVEKQRSSQQNKSFYAWIEEVASECEAQGVDRKTMVEDLSDASIPITGKFIKEVIWFHYMVAMYGKESTAQLTTKEMTEVEKLESKNPKFIIRPEYTEY